MGEQWFVLYCKSKEELRAQQNLMNLGIESFYPKICKEKIIRGKKQQVEEAIFPSYIFVYADKESTNFSKIRSTRGINDFVRFGSKIAKVSFLIIDQLKANCHSYNEHKIDSSELFKTGDKVQITTGAFKGLNTIFSHEDGLERAMLLLNILNQENQVSFKNNAISKLE